MVRKWPLGQVPGLDFYISGEITSSVDIARNTEQREGPPQNTHKLHPGAVSDFTRPVEGI